MPATTPTATLSTENGKTVLALAGDWTDYSQTPDWQSLTRQLDQQTKNVIIQDAGLGEWNSTLLAFVLNFREAVTKQSFTCTYPTLPQGVRGLLDLALAVPERINAKAPEQPKGFLCSIGRQLENLQDKTLAALDFVGLVSKTLWQFFHGKTRTKLRDILFQIARCGHQAIPIVSLMGFLIGVILAFIGSIPLKMFGADIYIATLIGIGVLRLMAATTVGTVMAGRTGAAFAAELGSMQANEEIDAYVAMGLSPVEILVLPRFIALSITLPVLCVYADFLGILGGITVSAIYTDVALNSFMQHMQETTSLSHFFIGVISSWIFGILIALCGCYHGLNCGRNSTAVGHAATAAVVSSIVCMVFATAIITLTTVVIGL